MALFDLDKVSSPLPDFDIELPKINTGSFLPRFDTVSDLFGGFPGMVSSANGFDMPDFFGGGFSANSGNFGGFQTNTQSFRSMLPSFGGFERQSPYIFPWDQPLPPTMPGSGYSGGVGVASGGYAVLNQYDNAFAQAASRFGNGIFDANWLKAVAMMEGGWGADATSGAGAQGIMQIMPGGYPDGEAMFPNWRTDPTQNIMLGAYILQQKINDNGGSRDMGTQRYLGFGTDPYTGISTQEYLRHITGFYNDLQKTTSPSGGGAPFTGQSGSGYLSVFGGQNYSIASYNGVKNGADESWYYAIDDELGIPIGTHAGLDVGTPMGTTLYMPKGLTGVVEVATGENGYGYSPGGGVLRSGPMTGELFIRLSNGHAIILGHMQRIFTPVGTKVTGGQALGLSGGAGSGPHVHFEYRIPGSTSSGWISVDPRQYLR